VQRDPDEETNLRIVHIIACAAFLSFPAPAVAQQATLTPPAETPLGSGPYRAVMEAEATLPGQTFYRPADLSAFGDGTLPIVLWGNGACANQGNAFRSFLSEIASYGFVVIALGPIDPGLPLYELQNVPATGPAAPFNPPPNITMPPSRTRAAQLIQAMDWAESANARASRYGAKLNTSAIAVMGMSCGGAQAIEAAADRRVRTAVMWNSGLFPAGTNMGGDRVITKDDLLLMNGAIAYISGDDSDIAFNNAEDDTSRLAAAGRPVFRAWQRGVGHGGNYSLANGGEFGGVAVAWLNWQLKGDERAALMFRGENCGLCVNPRWVARSSNLE
jgi:dienelactone hydrolase